MSITKPPNLGPAGNELWTEVNAAHDLRADEMSVLKDAARQADLIARMQREVDKTSFKLLITRPNGQEVINPIVTELRMARVAMTAMLRSLKLYDDSPEARSTAARAAVNVRWQQRKSA